MTEISQLRWGPWNRAGVTTKVEKPDAESHVEGRKGGDKQGQEPKKELSFSLPLKKATLLTPDHGCPSP